MGTFQQSRTLSFDPPTLAGDSNFSETLKTFFEKMKKFRKQLLVSSPETPDNWTKTVINGKIQWKQKTKKKLTQKSGDKKRKREDESSDSDGSYAPSSYNESDDDDSDDSGIGTAGSKLMSSVPARESSVVEQFNASFSSEAGSSKEDATAKKRQAPTGSSSINVSSTTYSKLSQIPLTTVPCSLFPVP